MHDDRFRNDAYENEQYNSSQQEASYFFEPAMIRDKRACLSSSGNSAPAEQLLTAGAVPDKPVINEATHEQQPTILEKRRLSQAR